MYLEHFGLREAPFSTTPDTRFLYLSQKHEEALAALLYGIAERKGFIVVTGEIGTGKTTLVRALANALESARPVPGLAVEPPARCRTAVVLNPLMEADELLATIADDLGIDLPPAPSRKVVLDRIHAFLLAEAEGGGNVAVVVDEAQNLSPATLEAVRSLSNLETEREKLVQIVLVGQPELDSLLRRPDLAQVWSRVVIRYHLAPMTLAETEAYVRHRLRIAGNERAVEFGAGALERLHDYTGGTPRLVNIICDKIMLAAYAAGTRRVEYATVERAIAEHEARPAATTGRAGRPAAGGRRRPWRRWTAALAAGAAAAAVVVAAWRWPGPEPAPPVPPPPTEAPAPERPPPPRVGWDADGVYRVEDAAASEAAALAAIARRWGAGAESITAALAAHADSPESFAAALGLRTVTVDGDLATLMRIDLPVAFPVRPVGGGDVVRVALMGATDAAYVFADPLRGRVEVPRGVFEAAPWRFRGARLLLPPGAPTAADPLAVWVEANETAVPNLGEPWSAEE